MDPETAFLQAALPEPAKILGQALRPYALGHEMILRRIGSPFVTGEQFPKEPSELAGKLFAAVYVCCFAYAEARECLADPNLSQVLEHWRRRLPRNFDVVEQAREFMAYLEAGSSSPTINRRPVPPGASKPGSPALLLYLTSLLKMGVPLGEALDTPYGFARWLYYSHWEGEGTCTISEEGEFNFVREKLAAAGLVPLTTNDEAAKEQYGL